MGFFDAFKKEVKREFIARPDEAKEQIIYKWPDSNIRMLTQLTVQPDEIALFVKNGQIAGTLASGTHTLNGADIPFLGALIDSATGGNFLISELYFVSTRQFTNLPFGGMIDNVVDPTTNLAIAIRLFGEYAIQVKEASKLIVNLVGTRNLTNNEELTEWFKQLLLKVFRETVSDYVSVQQKPVLGIASQASEFEQIVMEKIAPELEGYGVVIPKIGNVTVSIKEEDEATLKQMTRDFAYSKNISAADAAVKLGMAQGLQNNSGAGQNAAATFGAMTGMGMAMGQQAAQQAQTPVAPSDPQPNPAPVQPSQPSSN